MDFSKPANNKPRQVSLRKTIGSESLSDDSYQESLQDASTDSSSDSSSEDSSEKWSTLPSLPKSDKNTSTALSNSITSPKISGSKY